MSEVTKIVENALAVYLASVTKDRDKMAARVKETSGYKAELERLDALIDEAKTELVRVRNGRTV
jgi:hypothetical protein